MIRQANGRVMRSVLKAAVVAALVLGYVSVAVAQRFERSPGRGYHGEYHGPAAAHGYAGWGAHAAGGWGGRGGDPAVLVHAGFAIAIVDESEARKTLEYLAEVEPQELP